MCILCFIANAMYHMLYSIPFFCNNLKAYLDGPMTAI